MSKNLKIFIVAFLVGCGGANSIDVISLPSTIDLQIFTNSLVASIGILSFVVE